MILTQLPGATMLLHEWERNQRGSLTRAGSRLIRGTQAFNFSQ